MNEISIVYRPLALRDKRLIASYIAVDLASPKAALDTVSRIDDAIDLLLEVPAMGRPVNDDRLEKQGYRRLAVPHANYWVFYRFEAKERRIVIERILHQRMDIAPHMYYEMDYSDILDKKTSDCEGAR